MIDDPKPGPTAPTLSRSTWALLLAILVVATLLRLHDLGRASVWWDEIASLREARAGSLADMYTEMREVEATMAPLHPLMLRGWFLAFGPSDLSARLFSATCGLLTVLAVFNLGRRAFNPKVGLWAAWLTALSPQVLLFSREIRMYAPLVLCTVLAFDVLLSFRRAAPWFAQLAFVLLQVAIFYLYPLGMFVLTALGLAYLQGFRRSRLSPANWIVIEVAVALACVPWLRIYMDHPPGVVFGQNSWKTYVGWPIGFTGGNGLTLAGFLAMAGYGAWRSLRDRDDEAGPSTGRVLLLWFLVPSSLLIAYDLLRHPIFGPPRYLLFVAPAYLLLIARGVSALPAPARLAFGAAQAAMAGYMIVHGVFGAWVSHTDRRGAAEIILARDPKSTVAVLCFPETPHDLKNLEPMIYYLGRYREPTTPLVTLDRGLERLRQDPAALGDHLWLLAATTDQDLPAGEMARSLAAGVVPAEIDRRYETVQAWTPAEMRLFYLSRRPAPAEPGDPPSPPPPPRSD